MINFLNEIMLKEDNAACNRQNAAWTKVRRIRAMVHQLNKQIKRVVLRIE